MKDQLIKSIQQSFEKSIQLIISICESEIEKIFILKLINYVLKRPDRYNLGFLLLETETKIVGGKEVTTSEVNFQMPDGFGYLCGLRINNLISQTFIDIFPQHKETFIKGGKMLQTINYRLDFAVFKYSILNPKQILKKYCIECDGYDFHSSKDQIKSDNNRIRDLLLRHDYTTMRYLGTEIYNWEESEIGLFIWNL